MFLVVFLIDLPILLPLMSSFKTTREIAHSIVTLPATPSFANFQFLIARSDFGIWIRNSFIVATGAAVGSLIPAILGGYTLSRYRGKALGFYASTLLVVSIFPAMVILIPLFIVIRDLGLIDTFGSVIVLLSAALLPYSTWVARGFFDGIPLELEEAAWVDGASRLRALVLIVVPLSGAGVAAIGVLSFMTVWNEYLFASLFLRDESMLTVSVGLRFYTNQYVTDLGSLMAAATMAMLPSLVLLLLLRKYVVSAPLAGSTKG
jgi:ABC-type glycerol-3-phosphate transport system permease component